MEANVQHFNAFGLRKCKSRCKEENVYEKMFAIEKESECLRNENKNH